VVHPALVELPRVRDSIDPLDELLGVVPEHFEEVHQVAVLVVLNLCRRRFLVHEDTRGAAEQFDVDLVVWKVVDDPGGKSSFATGEREHGRHQLTTPNPTESVVAVGTLSVGWPA
jgi:hypothetical protein